MKYSYVHSSLPNIQCRPNKQVNVSAMTKVTLLNVLKVKQDSIATH